MTRLRHSLAVALFFAAAATAHAADDQGRFAVKGPGLATCKYFTEQAQQKSQQFYLMAGWLFGFISGQNAHLQETYDATSWQSDEVLIGMMDNYCKQRPEDRYAEGAIKLLQALMRNRLEAESRLVVAANGDHKVAVYEEVLRRMQEKMREQGYYRGVVDGLYGPGTKTSIEAYQSANKLPVTGVPDGRTLFVLFKDELAPKKPDQ